MVHARFEPKFIKLMCVSMIAAVASIAGVHPMSVTKAEVSVDDVYLHVGETEEAGELHWRECGFSLSAIYSENESHDLSHNSYWIEVELATGNGGYGELDLLLLDSGVEFRQLVESGTIPLDLIQRVPIRGNRTVQLDVSSFVAIELERGITDFRFALGRLDASSMGMIELFPGGSDQSGRVIAVQAD